MSRHLLSTLTALSALLLAGCEAPLSTPFDSLATGITDKSRSHSDSSGRDCQHGPTPLPPALPPALPPVLSPTTPESDCWTQEFRQPGRTKKLDLLFVTDTSGSLNEERSEIAEGIDSFIRALPRDQDIRIGVMLGHGPDSRYSGRLWKAKNESWVLSNTNESREQLRQELKNKLHWQASEWATDGGEMGMGSLLSSLRGARLHEARAHGFFRTDAALAVVFISDENDICAEYPAGVERVFDPDRKELAAKARYCTAEAGITAQNLVSELKSLQQDRPLVVSGILYTNPSRVPRGLENEVGYGYLDAIRAAGSGGFEIEMADGHFEDGLRRLGNFTAEQIELQHRFALSQTADRFTVRVDGIEVEFERDGTIIELEDAGREFSVISIQGCRNTVEPPQPEPTPSPTATVTPSPEPTPIATVTPAPEPTPTASPIATPTPEPSQTPPVTDPVAEPMVIGV